MAMLGKQDIVLGAIWRWSLRNSAAKEVVAHLLATRAGLGIKSGRQLAEHWETTEIFRAMREAAR